MAKLGNHGANSVKKEKRNHDANRVAVVEEDLVTAFQQKSSAIMNSESQPSGRVAGDDDEEVNADGDYLFVKVMKAKGLNGNPDLYAELNLGEYKRATGHLEKTSDSEPEWNEVFSLLKDRIRSKTLEIYLKDKTRDSLIGGVVIGGMEVPRRVPPDRPLAPKWYQLEDRNKRICGELMLSIWVGTEADEEFPKSSRLIKTTNRLKHSLKHKVYLSPKLWYLRVKVLEAEIADSYMQQPEILVKAAHGNTVLRTKISQTKDLNPWWDEDLMFTVAEPIWDQLVLVVEEKTEEGTYRLGHCAVPLHIVDNRMDFMAPTGKWFNLEKESQENLSESEWNGNSRLHLAICFDGGYHVFDEPTNYTSDLRPAYGMRKPEVGLLEITISNASLVAMKSEHGRESTDAYCVIKYGPKWIRTNTKHSTIYPAWNEQCNFPVYDLCTVMTLGVFHNCNLQGGGAEEEDSRMGKIRIHLSTLETNQAHTRTYPLRELSSAGVRNMGSIQLTVRFSCSSLFDLLHLYIQPVLPSLHYHHPLTSQQVLSLRVMATKILSARLSREEPPLSKNVIEYILEGAGVCGSDRRINARYLNKVITCFDEICTWKNPGLTLIVFIFFCIVTWFPWLVSVAVFAGLFMIGMWMSYGRRRDAGLFLEMEVMQDDDDSFFRVQTLIGSMATQWERLCNLLSRRDPRATILFLVFCLGSTVIHYFIPQRFFVIMIGFYIMRFPRLRSPVPFATLNFWRRSHEITSHDL